jgi:hypothetical protein
MPDRVVWLPTSSAGCDTRLLGVPVGGVVALEAIPAGAHARSDA